MKVVSYVEYDRQEVLAAFREKVEKDGYKVSSVDVMYEDSDEEYGFNGIKVKIEGLLQKGVK